MLHFFFLTLFYVSYGIIDLTEYTIVAASGNQIAANGLTANRDQRRSFYAVDQQTFNDVFQNSLCNIIYRYCDDCLASHTDIFYRRFLDPETFEPFDYLLNNWYSYNNDADAGDFSLYSTQTDAITDTNAWTYCNYDDMGVAFPRDCGPSGNVGGQWNSFYPDRPGSRINVLFAVYTGTDCAEYYPLVASGTYVAPGNTNGLNGVELVPNRNGPVPIGQYWNSFEWATKPREPLAVACPIIRRQCDDCPPELQDLYYRRLTPWTGVLAGVNYDVNIEDLFLNVWSESQNGPNVFNVDFSIYDNLLDARQNNVANRFQTCTFSGVPRPTDTFGFPKECGPIGGITCGWNMYREYKPQCGGSKKDILYSVYQGPAC